MRIRLARPLSEMLQTWELKSPDICIINRDFYNVMKLTQIGVNFKGVMIALDFD